METKTKWPRKHKLTQEQQRVWDEFHKYPWEIVRINRSQIKTFSELLVVMYEEFGGLVPMSKKAQVKKNTMYYWMLSHKVIIEKRAVIQDHKDRVFRGDRYSNDDFRNYGRTIAIPVMKNKRNENKDQNYD